VCGGAFAVEIPFDDGHWLQLENEDGLPYRGRKSRPYNAFSMRACKQNVEMSCEYYSRLGRGGKIDLWRYDPVSLA